MTLCIIEVTTFPGKGKLRANAAYRLSGKNPWESGCSIALFRIFQRSLWMIQVRPRAPKHPLHGADLNPGLAGLDGSTSGPVEGINTKIRVVLRRGYGVRKVATLWSRVLLDVNWAWKRVGQTIAGLRQLVGRIQAHFAECYT